MNEIIQSLGLPLLSKGTCGGEVSTNPVPTLICNPHNDVLNDA